MADNPQAFPVVAENGLGHIAPGMTLLDYFAGQALAAMTFLKGDGSYSAVEVERKAREQDAEWVAKAAYRYAAAMLNERQSHEG